MLIRAREGRAAAKAARDASSLRRDFLQEPYWLELAHRFGVRLPAYGIPITVGAVRRWLRKLGYTTDYYREWQGDANLGAFALRNPRWPMRALAGLLLEEKEAGQ